MLSAHRPFPWIAFATLQALDVATTAIALTNRAAREGNPTAAHLMSAYGQPLAYTAKLAGIAVVIAALHHYRHRRWARTLLYVGITVTAITVISNTTWLLTH